MVYLVYVSLSWVFKAQRGIQTIAEPVCVLQTRRHSSPATGLRRGKITPTELSLRCRRFLSDSVRLVTGQHATTWFSSFS